jgi:hypothetical protein
MNRLGQNDFSRPNFNDLMVNAAFVAKMRSRDLQGANSRRDALLSTAAS